MEEKSGPAWPVIVLPALLVTSIFLLLSVPPAYAATCTDGTFGTVRYYYAVNSDTQDNNGQLEGVGTTITNTNTWTFNAPIAHSTQLWWVTLVFPSSGWSQAGIGKGTFDGQTISSRSIYFEQSRNGQGTPSMVYVSGHTIPDGDTGYQEAWLYVGSNGDYWTTDQVSSSSQGTWSTNYDLGSSSPSLSYGTGEQSIEAAYDGSQSSYTCNSYTASSSSNNAVYTKSLGVEPEGGSGFAWGNTCTQHIDSPYNLQLVFSNCALNINFWGG